MSPPKKKTNAKRPVEAYEHADKKRANNPPAGLVTPETDPDRGQKKKKYDYDPHLDPTLVWTGKTEHTSFDVPTVSLHVHERIDPKTIVESVKRKNGEKKHQLSLFREDRDSPLRSTLEFYKHPLGWKNRLIAGDSLLVMNSLLEKEGLGGQVQMIYIDPPYGIRYGSNFQPFTNKRDVKDGSDDDLTLEPETLKAFRDTWELGIHSYLTYLRDRLLLAKELLHASGSCFVQISDENIHHVRELMDEVFGSTNFVSEITVQKTGGGTAGALKTIADYLLFYAKDRACLKYRDVFVGRGNGGAIPFSYDYVELDDGTIRRLTDEERASERIARTIGRVFQSVALTSSHEYSRGKEAVQFGGRSFTPGGRYWSTSPEGIERLIHANRILATKATLRYKMMLDDFAVTPLNNVWSDVMGASSPIYVVQTNEKVIQRCLLMTTDPGDLVLDPTCGSGTTAVVAEQWGRRWITTDTSRVAITLAKQRLMTAVFDYYTLAHPEQGVGSGFKYKTVPHVTLKSIANNPEIKEGMTREQIDRAIAKYADTETLYDQPEKDRSKSRVTGPFTVEAVPAPMVMSIEDTLSEGKIETEREFRADASIARSGETIRQEEWRDELLRTGIRGKGGQYIRFSRLEALPGCRSLSADGETIPVNEGEEASRTVVSFGPQHAPFEQRQVEDAIREAQNLVPRPKLVVFASFQFDPEAAKDIDETNWPGVTLLKAQMNADLLTDDLRKKRASNESFWLIGQPDVRIERVAKGEDKGRLKVHVEGFDYYNTRTGGIESGGSERIAVWLLDTDYDGRSLFPCQVFFPMAGAKDGWARLAKSLKAEIDEEKIEMFRGTESLPFDPGSHRRIAVKIVDDRGIESLKIMEAI
ncbi:MAG: site-specific DNA-methyltransferase [Planctomycetes bacterium]|nr:site-specific DNA-methyltransferase [Planctomycetota bacterium]